MKAFKIGLAIALLISSISAIVISQKLYAADTNKSVISIKAYREKVAVEREAIIADGCKLQEAKKAGDKATIEQVKQETDQDIKKRKAVIKALYKDMQNKTTNKYNIDYNTKKK